ncbi:MAG: peptide chain release factor-like protein [Lentisphaeria bacterium]|nr:peptide chain release factor-like protein [Lentisphaeria bacterium]
MKKYELLSLSDEELLRQCRFEARRGTGPGGQKRNKTSTATRVTHEPTGLTATDDVTRSQHQNLAHALMKLRCEIAVKMPAEADENAPEIPLDAIPKATRPEFAIWLAKIFDALQAHDFNMAESANALGLSSGAQLTRLLSKEDLAWQKLAEARQRLKLPPLHK